MNTCLLLLFLIWSASAIDRHDGIDLPSGVEPGNLTPATDSKAFPPGADLANGDGILDVSEQKDIDTTRNSDNNPNDENNSENISVNDSFQNKEDHKKGSGTCDDENHAGGSKIKFFQNDCNEVLPQLTYKTKLPNQIGIAITACLSLPTIWMSRNIALFYKDKAKTQVYLFKFKQPNCYLSQPFD